jgi:chemosensory pili system protein ChpC
MNGLAMTDIRGLLIPIGGQRLLLPNATVAEIIAYRDPAPAAEGSPSWLLGNIDWRQRDVPTVALENMFGGEYQGYTRGRIAVCYSLLAGTERPYLGVVSDGIPHLVRVRAEDIEPLPPQGGDSDLPLLARLKLKGEDALIPDVARLSELAAA